MRWALGLLLSVSIAGGVGYVWLRGQSEVGAGYVAKELCSCIFVGGRDLASCRPDIPPSMDAIEAEVGEDRVRAFVPAFTERMARHEPPFGCVLY